ncbi:unnamed protein product [Gongylonema pulchrum]|uniref:ICA69 domain-containing protein n=1 Tax=Gongylonema pulchrum TaxID=637853 RepID=A0A183CXV0_9BILA|nr:unnamed protein product [Gongylonema pulchrum]
MENEDQTMHSSEELFRSEEEFVHPSDPEPSTSTLNSLGSLPAQGNSLVQNDAGAQFLDSSVVEAALQQLFAPSMHLATLHAQSPSPLANYNPSSDSLEGPHMPLDLLNSMAWDQWLCCLANSLTPAQWQSCWIHYLTLYGTTGVLIHGNSMN